mmetsp:Transcript_25875/g.68798  ORF Transcript_25875/g.68798 Transcript_25875/m.68798 type:complete len:338 (+) Transcript_25875:129-1142(+)
MGKCSSKAGCAVPETSAQHEPVLLGRGHHRGVGMKASATSGLVRLTYPMPTDFQPKTDKDPALPKAVEVTVLSSSVQGHFGEKGTIVFLHGAGGSAEDYEKLWATGDLALPSGFTIVFVQSPRGSYEQSLKTPWLQPSKYWGQRPQTLEWQVDDDVTILKHVLWELQREAGGYSKLWLCGRSQGACLSLLLAVAGVGPTVAGAFVIAGAALPQLLDIPSGETYTQPSQQKFGALRLGFYSGEVDDQFTNRHPGEEGGTFPVLRKRLTDLGFFSGDQEDHFWLKKGAGHSSIGPDSKYGADAFKVLFAFVQHQDPATAGVQDVIAWRDVSAKARLVSL